MSSDNDWAKTQGQNDASQNKGPAQSHTWDADVRNSYNNAYQREREQQRERQG
jgi:hypothetical protein